MVQAVGPLGAAIETDGTVVKGRVGYQFKADANALVVLHRVAFVDLRGQIDGQGQAALLRWAAQYGLGQDGELVRQVAARRQRAVQALRDQGYAVERLIVRPQWRLAVGLGNRANAHEIGLSLHGTYGWPVIPGSTLKGLACAWALESGDEPERVGAVLGLPRVGEAADRPEPGSARVPPTGAPKASMGTVRFLDAIPAGQPVRVSRDVLTPHVKPYYDDIARDGSQQLRPPAEYHNPVPVQFLVVDQGSFAVDLVGPVTEDVDQAARWCEAALDELGVGGKTSAGYGYLAVSQAPPMEPAR
jgi:CRISPR type III-B/RAMP module RAMP protein Cmr6